ncbi:MAG: hypothetical protein K8H88_19925 [Sandaracinaceae bacterium]|nr:hypothetical protein [Sandaracinaceae bacterium]
MKKRAGGQSARRPRSDAALTEPVDGARRPRRKIDSGIPKQRPPGDPPAKLSAAERAGYVAAVRAEHRGSISSSEAGEKLAKLVELYQGVREDAQTLRRFHGERQRAVGRLRDALRNYLGSVDGVDALADDARALLHRVEAAHLADEEIPFLKGAEKTYLRYTAALPRVDAGQSGWKIIVAWGCAMDGYSHEIAAIVEDAGIRTDKALRQSCTEFILSDPGYAHYVKKRWRETFRSLFTRLEDVDRAQLRASRLPGAAQWIPRQRSTPE